MKDLKVRNLRNNNPANLPRKSSWLGLVPYLVDKTTNQMYFDHRYCQFESDVYGVRALIVVIRKLVYRKKLHSISSILFAFRPLSDCNTYAYIADVCRFIKDKYNEQGMFGEMIVDADSSFNLFVNPKTLSFFGRCFIKAILCQETCYLCSDEILDKALELL